MPIRFFVFFSVAKKTLNSLIINNLYFCLSILIIIAVKIKH